MRNATVIGCGIDEAWWDKLLGRKEGLSEKKRRFTLVGEIEDRLLPELLLVEAQIVVEHHVGSERRTPEEILLVLFLLVERLQPDSFVTFIFLTCMYWTTLRFFGGIGGGDRGSPHRIIVRSSYVPPPLRSSNFSC